MTIDLKAALNKFKTTEEKIQYLHQLTLTTLKNISQNNNARFRTAQDGCMIINKIIHRHMLPNLSESVKSNELLTLKSEDIVEKVLSTPSSNPEHDRFFNRNEGTILGYIYLCICILSLLNRKKSINVRLEEIITCITVLIKTHYNDKIFSSEEKIMQCLIFLIHVNPPLKLTPSMSDEIINKVFDNIQQFFENNKSLHPTGFSNNMIALLTEKELAIMTIFRDMQAVPAANITSELEKLYHDLISVITNDAQEQDPFDVAANFFIRFNKIHPFTDGNGRVSRKLVDDILCTLLPKHHVIRQNDGIFKGLVHEASSDENTRYAFVTDAMNVELLSNYLRTNKFLNCEFLQPMIFTPRDTYDGYDLQNSINYLLKHGVPTDLQIITAHSNTISALSSKLYNFLPTFNRQRAFTGLASAVMVIGGASMYANLKN